MISLGCTSLPFRPPTPLTSSSGFPINLKRIGTLVGTNVSTLVSTNELNVTAS